MQHKYNRVYFLTRSDFTLIEMLVVVAIISILASMLLPSLRNALESARAISCSNNQKQLNFVFNQYYSDNNNIIPPAIITYNATNLVWGNILVLGGYIPAEAIAYNPTNTTLLCPSSDVTNNNKVIYTQGHYGMNCLITYNVGSPPPEFHKVTSYSRPSKTVLMLDSGNSYIHYGHISVPSANAWYVPGAFNNNSLSWNFATYNNRDDALFGRHNQRINVTWLDGHIDTVAADDLNVSTLWNP